MGFWFEELGNSCQIPSCDLKNYQYFTGKNYLLNKFLAIIFMKRKQIEKPEHIPTIYLKLGQVYIWFGWCVVLADLLGAEMFTNSFGLLLLFQGVATFIGPPIVGG